MKRISILCSLLCIIAFTQCNKGEPISELIAQEEVSYENLEKVETLWEEGCGKELIEWTDEEQDGLKIVRQGLSPYSADVGVIRLSSHCGDYPTLKVAMDCEDSSPITMLKHGVIPSNDNRKYFATPYGVKADGNVEIYFCLVPHAPNDWPNVRIGDSGSWGLLCVNYGISNNSVPYDIIYRFFDNEDKNNKNSGTVTWKNNGTNYTYGLAPKVAGGFSTNGIWQGNDTRLAFIRKHMSPNSYGSDVNKNNFPNLGFNYAVLSSKPVVSTLPFVSELLIDDEDTNNTNSWGYNTLPDSRSQRDYDFIKGERNTHIFIAPVVYEL